MQTRLLKDRKTDCLPAGFDPGRTRQIAAGYALGFLIGTTPLIGMKVLIALALSSVLKVESPCGRHRGLSYQQPYRAFFPRTCLCSWPCYPRHKDHVRFSRKIGA
ncbi:MAG: DUF2062 domain-containing protein [Saprospirales bacterium]|nr:DUF2062 domain-containing protein [Saprospirales bacterium]